MAFDTEATGDASVILPTDAISAAETLADLASVHGNKVHHLGRNRDGQYGVDALKPYRIILTPNPLPVPQDDSGRKELEKVTSVWVEEIVDYH